MKRFTTTALAAIMFAAPMAATSAYADTPARHDDRGDRFGDNRSYNDNDHNDRSDRGDRNEHRRGDDRRDNHRWDNQRHNGYSYNGRWNYGPPPQAIYGRQGFEPGYRNWRRGDRLPSYYQQSYRQVDYRRAYLRAPPRGYHYVQDDRGETLLVALATGVILSIILSGR